MIAIANEDVRIATDRFRPEVDVDVDPSTRHHLVMDAEKKHAQKEMPATYKGREQAYIKHQLLESYLEKLFLIVGMSAKKLGISELCYVDCFAGPWLDDSEDLSGTSIAISLRILEKCRETLGSFGIGLKCRALFIEEDATAFTRLQRYLTQRLSKRVAAEAMRGDFVALRDDILRWCGRDAFVFFFVDPKGWKEIGVDTLRPLLERSMSEFLLNFQYDFVNRTASMSEWREEIKLLLGESIDVDGHYPEQRERIIVDTYRRNLKLRMPGTETHRARSAYVRVMDPRKDRPKYHLVYLTMHPRGITEFMEISESVGLIQKRVRAYKKEGIRADESRMDDMFGAESLIDAHEGRVEDVEVDRFWLSYLSSGAKLIGEAEFADILEQTNWFESDLQDSLARLINAGRVRNSDARRKRPKKPLHWKDKETIQLSEVTK